MRIAETFEFLEMVKIDLFPEEVYTFTPAGKVLSFPAGATPIDQAPRPGSRGTTVAFVHPKGSFGTLIELVQE